MAGFDRRLACFLRPVWTVPIWSGIRDYIWRPRNGGRPVRQFCQTTNRPGIECTIQRIGSDSGIASALFLRHLQLVAQLDLDRVIAAGIYVV